jgi:hypothetical protein
VTPRGEFVLDLPTGAHLVLVEHHVRSGAEAVHEAWYAYVDVADDETSPRDLGVHSFGAPLIRGVLRGAGGAPRPGAMVDVSDEQLEPARRLVRGIHLRVLTGDGGRFAVGIARTDGTEVVTRVSARVGSAEARADGVRLGDTIELVLADDGGTDVAFELPWSEGQRVCVRSLDRRLGFMIAGGRAPPGGVQEERRRLPPGRYEVLVTRGARGSEEWARTEVAVDASPGQRIRFDPRFRPARSVRGRLAPGTEVSWLAKATDGSTLVRERTRAGADGLFALHGLPTSEVLLQLGTTLTAVPAGTAPDVDLGEPNPR